MIHLRNAVLEANDLRRPVNLQDQVITSSEPHCVHSIDDCTLWNQNETEQAVIPQALTCKSNVVILMHDAAMLHLGLADVVSIKIHFSDSHQGHRAEACWIS